VAIVVVILLVPGLAALMIAIRLIRWALRRRESNPPPIPEAQIVTDGKDPLRPSAETVPTADVTLRVIAGTTGTAILVGLGYVVYVAYEISQHGLFGDSLKMGRPLRIAGVELLPDVIAGGSWDHHVRPALDLADDERRWVASMWLAAARTEHASIAAFERLARQLAHHDAPAALVARCRAAAGDEVRHARSCFALASAFAATPLAAHASASIDLDERVDLVTIARESIVDGCLGEGLAADVAAHGATRATDPAIQTTLAMIAADESRHAELAWDIVAWCAAAGGAVVRGAITDALTRLDAPVSTWTHAAPPARHGFVGAAIVAELAARRRRSVIERARALDAGAGVSDVSASISD
jgi:hypothetical protein